jgi:hypothetical protein
LFAYVTVAVVLRPPTPVTAAEHGVRYEPVYVTEAVGHVITVVDAAKLIVNEPSTTTVVV